MPIANVFLTPDLSPPAPESLIERWSAESSISSDEMTVNLISSSSQAGRPYSVMAWLYLPSLWLEDDVASLQEGLATALATTCGVDHAEVQVITQIVQSGRVVAGGSTVRWSENA